MSVLIAKASGNLTASTSWGVVDSTSYLNAENATESLLTTAYSGTRSSPFTPGAITIDGIAVKLCEIIGTTGTISVNLEKDSDDSQVAGTEVTINVADLPSCLEANLNGGWIFFKFASPVTLAGATAYQVAAKTSSATMVDLWCDGTADNLARALRTTTEQAPAAGDDMIICGEKTSAGAETAITVTMNGTATTDYGSAPTAANSLIGPGLAICDGGTLQYGTTAATNYYLKMSNSIIVYSGGTFNIGTTGTPIPRDSTAVLEFDPGADGDYGLIARNLSTLNIQGLSRTSGKNIVQCKLNTDEAANSTSLGVDTDTGWLDNDEIVVASTTRTASQTEKGTLNGNAGASSLTVDGFAGTGGGLANAHGGTSPVQAEVILLTRNVKIRSATSTIMAYVYTNTTSIIDIDWAEFYYIGENATGKKGVEAANTTGAFNMDYCSIHDTEDGGLYLNAGSAIASINNIVMYNTNTAVATAVTSLYLQSSSTLGFSASYITLLYPHTSTSQSSPFGAIYCDRMTLNMSNIVVAGLAENNDAVILNQGSAAGTATPGVFSNFTIHSNAGGGLTFTSNIPGGNILFDTFKIWRNSGVGVRTYYLNNGAWVNSIKFLNSVFTANTTSNFSITSIIIPMIIFDTCTFNADASFATTNGIINNASSYVKIYLLNCEFGSGTAHTNDINCGNTALVECYAINTNLLSATEISTPTTLSHGSFIKSHKNDQSSTTFKNTYRIGTIQSEQTIRHTASGFSWKLTPSSTINKLILPGPTIFDTFKAAVNASSQVTITAYVYKDSSYDGNAPRLVILGGIIGGVASDVTDSLTVAHSNWEQLSVQATPNEAGVIEYYIDCDGTAGNVYVDDIAVTQA